MITETVASYARSRPMPPYLEPAQTRDWGSEKVAYFNLIYDLTFKLAQIPGGAYVVLGPGKGLEARMMGRAIKAAENPASVVNLEISPEVLKQLRGVTKEEGWPGQSLLLADARVMPLRPESARLITASSVIHEAADGNRKDLQDIIQGIADSLSPHGIAIIREMTPWSYGDVTLIPKTKPAREFCWNYCSRIPLFEDEEFSLTRTSKIPLLIKTSSVLAAEIARHFQMRNRVYRIPETMDEWSEVIERYFGWTRHFNIDPENIPDSIARGFVSFLPIQKKNDYRVSVHPVIENLGDKLLNDNFALMRGHPNGREIPLERLPPLPPNQRLWIFIQKIPKSLPSGNGAEPRAPLIQVTPPWKDEDDLKGQIQILYRFAETGEQPPERTAELLFRLRNSKHIFMSVDQVLAYTNPKYLTEIIQEIALPNEQSLVKEIEDIIKKSGGKIYMADIQAELRHLGLDRRNFFERLDQKLKDDLQRRHNATHLEEDVTYLRKLVDEGVHLHLVSENPKYFLAIIQEKLQDLGVAIDTICSLDDVSHRLPHPEIYRLAAKQVAEKQNRTLEDILRESAFIGTNPHQIGATQSLAVSFGSPTPVYLLRETTPVDPVDMPHGPWLRANSIEDLVIQFLQERDKKNSA